MSARPWKPSKRASEAIAAAWDAFYSGDSWLRTDHPSTARYTLASLHWNGVAEIDPADSHRFRLSEAELNANGLTRSIRFFAGVSLNELDAITDAIDSAVAA